jgi:hypothetical protein
VPSKSSQDVLTSTKKNFLFEVRVIDFSSEKSSKGRTLLDVFTFEKINAAKLPTTRGRILGRKLDKSLESFPPCFSQSL